MTQKRRNPGTQARATSTTPFAEPKPTTAGRQCHANTVAGLHRRRQVSQRLVPLLLHPETLQALYRRGGADRTLVAEQLHQLTGGVVA